MTMVNRRVVCDLKLREAVAAAQVCAEQWKGDAFVIYHYQRKTYQVADRARKESGRRTAYRVTPQGEVFPQPRYPTLAELALELPGDGHGKGK